MAMFIRVTTVILSVLCNLNAEYLDRASRIIGGVVTQVRFPFMVTVNTRPTKENGGDHSFCGGSIINQQWVLTAAHCVIKSRNADIPISTSSDSVLVLRSNSQNNTSTNNLPYRIRNPDYITVSYGSLNQNKMKKVGVKSVHVPGFYNNSVYVGDFALLELELPLSFDSNTRAVKISSSAISTNISVTAIGYGSTKQDKYSPSERLKLTTLKTGTTETCSAHRSRFTDNNSEVICCPTYKNSDTCFGDSGSPLLGATLSTQSKILSSQNSTADAGVDPNDYEDEWVLLGLTSYGDSLSDDFVCAGADGVGFYTNAYYYSDLISKITGIPAALLLSNATIQEFDIRQASKSSQIQFINRILYFIIPLFLYTIF